MHVGVSDTSTDRSPEFGNSASVEAPPIVDAVRGEGPGSPPQPRPTPDDRYVTAFVTQHSPGMTVNTIAAVRSSNYLS